MNETSWNECLKNNMSLKISPDKGLARSLIETAKQRVIFTEKKHPENGELKFVFEDYYSSMIEIIHAMLAVKGYKALNHLCLGFFIKDTLKKEKDYRTFDRLRIKRNNITYYGKDIDCNILKEDIQDIKKLIKTLEESYIQSIKR